MKKYLISIVAVLVLLGGAAYADTISLIGKKVQSQTDVILNGEKIDEVIIIDGKSYAPVRSISEAVGVQVDFVDGKVILTDNNQTTEKPLTKQQLIYKLENLESDKNIKEIQLKGYKDAVPGLISLRDQYKSFVERGKDVTENQKQVEFYENGIKDNLAEQDKLEAELKTLNETIADVKDQISKM